MRDQWIGKNVDLALLSGCVENFFKVRGLKTVKEESAGKCKISVIPQNARDTRGGIYIRILGDPNNFVIEFYGSERVRSSIKWGLITTLFGGGPFLLRSLRLQEALEKIEREFWVYVEETIARLADSAKRLTRT